MFDSVVKCGLLLGAVGTMLSGCGFQGAGIQNQPIDAKLGVDSADIDAGSSVDANALDAMPDAVPPPARVTANLVALYEFNDPTGSRTVKDSAPDPLDLELRTASAGSVVFDSVGLTVNRAVAFIPGQGADSINKFRTCHSGPTAPANDELTIEAWVSALPSPGTGTTPGSQIVTMFKAEAFSGAQTPLTIDAGLRQVASEWSGQVRTSANSASLIEFKKLLDTSNLIPTQVVFVAATGPTGTGTLYANGVQLSSLALSGTFAPWSAIGTVLFGEVTAVNPPTAQRFWNGRITRLAIYCRALTAAEIQTHYSFGSE